ncbi:hypothetical protein D9M68_976170 [compost metagenome]
MQRDGGCVVGQLLDAGQRVGRAGVEAIAQGQRLVQGFAGGADLVDHAKLLQPLGANAVAAQQQLQRGGTGQGTHQTPGGATIGRQAHVAVGHHEHTALRGHHQIAGQRERKAGAGA